MAEDTIIKLRKLSMRDELGDKLKIDVTIGDKRMSDAGTDGDKRTDARTDARTNCDEIMDIKEPVMRRSFKLKPIDSSQMMVNMPDIPQLILPPADIPINSPINSPTNSPINSQTNSPTNSPTNSQTNSPTNRPNKQQIISPTLAKKQRISFLETTRFGRGYTTSDKYQTILKLPSID